MYKTEKILKRKREESESDNEEEEETKKNEEEESEDDAQGGENDDVIEGSEADGSEGSEAEESDDETENVAAPADSGSVYKASDDDKESGDGKEDDEVDNAENAEVNKDDEGFWNMNMTQFLNTVHSPQKKKKQTERGDKADCLKLQKEVEELKKYKNEAAAEIEQLKRGNDELKLKLSDAEKKGENQMKTMDETFLKLKMDVEEKENLIKSLKKDVEEKDKKMKEMDIEIMFLKGQSFVSMVETTESVEKVKDPVDENKISEMAREIEQLKKGNRELSEENENLINQITELNCHIVTQEAKAEKQKDIPASAKAETHKEIPVPAMTEQQKEVPVGDKRKPGPSFVLLEDDLDTQQKVTKKKHKEMDLDSNQSALIFLENGDKQLLKKIAKMDGWG